MSGNIVGTPRNLFAKFKFRIEIDGIAYAGFQKCSELSAEAAVIEHYEGGAIIPVKLPGRVKFPDVTLEQGACNDLDLYKWWLQVANVAAGQGGLGQPDPRYRRNLEIIQLERDDTIVQRWKLRNAWPSKFVAADGFDNTADEVVITSVQLTYDYWVPAFVR
jgi:phage tail-like protein